MKRLCNYALLRRTEFPCFSDEMLGTASAVLAGILASLLKTGGRLADHTFMFSGKRAADLDQVSCSTCLLVPPAQWVPQPLKQGRICCNRFLSVACASWHAVTTTCPSTCASWRCQPFYPYHSPRPLTATTTHHVP